MRTSLLCMAVLAASCASAPVSAPETPEITVPDPQPLALPYAEIEAESTLTTGAVSAFSTSLYDPGAEASGRRYVSLPPGKDLSLTVPRDGDSVVVRFSLPDRATTLALATAGGSVSMNLTRQFQGAYGRPKWGSANVWRDGPGAGSQRHFWDEASTRTPAFTAGSEVRLTNTGNAAVLVDLLDFEKVPPVLAAPEGSLSFADYHPDATGKHDVTDLFQKALDEAKGRTVYVPEGVYRIDAVFLSDVSVQGAGLWRTRFVGPLSQFRFSGKAARVADLAIFGETTIRNDTSDEEDAFAGQPAPGSSVERVWVEHKKCAFWVGNWGSRTGTKGLTIAECRFRDTTADGINLCSGTTDTVVRDCLIRNTGDDGLAAWSPHNGGLSGGRNSMLRNVIQLPWVANGIALYGGGPFTVEGNLVKDTVTTGSGIYVSASFQAWPFTGAVDIKDNVLVRCGAHETDSGGPAGAIRILAADAPLTGATLTFTDNTVVDPVESAVSIHGPLAVGDLTFSGLSVSGLHGQIVDVRANASGSAVFTGLAGDAETGTWRNLAGADFTVSR